jgi:hypothetical protein
MTLNYHELDDVKRGHLIGNTLDRRQIEEEDQAWLDEESRRGDVVAKLIYHGGDVTFQSSEGFE